MATPLTQAQLGAAEFARRQSRVGLGTGTVFTGLSPATNPAAIAGRNPAALSTTNPGPTLYAGGSQQFAQQNYGTASPQWMPQAPQGGILASAQPTLQSPVPQGQQPYQQPAGQPPIQQAEFERINPNLRTVQSNETVLGQLEGILASNSPLLQQARARAAEGMQGRGLLNSSIALGAADDAAYARAEQWAVPDARTYAEAAKGNQDAINRIAEANQREFGATSRENAGFVNRRGDINVEQAGAMDRLNIQEAGQTARQNSANETSIRTTGMNNATTIQATGMNNATSIQTANISADTSRYGYELSAATQRDVAQYNNESAIARDSSRMSFEADQNMQNRVQQIVTNPDMTQEYRDRAIQDIVAGGRATHQLASSVRSINLAVR